MKPLALVALALSLFSSAAGAGEAGPGPRGRQIVIADRGLRERVATALLDAFDRLEAEGCQTAFGEEYRLTLQRLTELTFVDGRKDPVCRATSGVSSWVPLSANRITICAKFEREKDPAAILLHEAFHSVGVDEGTSVSGSQALTARVQAVCR